jgi:molybdopterin converting factor small subunit
MTLTTPHPTTASYVDPIDLRREPRRRITVLHLIVSIAASATRPFQESTMITLELFGVPRLRAGLDRLDVEASRVGDALRRLAEACPALAGSVIEGERLGRAYKLSLNGGAFVDDPATPLADGDSLILMAADVGG